MSKTSGVCAERSQVHMADILDGASNTYLVGEKYLSADSYTTGVDWGDDQGALCGDSDDLHRWTYLPPAQDTPGMTAYYIFGSPHASGLNMAFCDGAVKTVTYSIDATVHLYLGNRKDGQTIDGKSL
jgi:prepilin-type processing-associated H-X9-DG protein